ncbi:hypothetical protein SSP35_12_01240 [Streptomyces sp. NBRC 110611]|nr:hypothetical protein SSP35_12_01240 [Streptomyces sp. NBRC 110611]
MGSGEAAVDRRAPTMTWSFATRHMTCARLCAAHDLRPSLAADTAWPFATRQTVPARYGRAREAQGANG